MPNKMLLYCIVMQSAYILGHSTETTLLRIQTDMLRAINSKKCVFPVLLDMSAAFDTVDHGILIHWLSNRLGIHGKALQWVESYLKDRKQFVIVEGSKSEVQHLDSDVPQGSILGPGFFGNYCVLVSDIFMKHGITYHLYADDTQGYVPFHPKEEAEVLEQLTRCLQEVRLWMATHYLKLNDSKTDLIILVSKHNLKSLFTSDITIGDEIIKAGDIVKNIGATFDKHLKLETQVVLTCRNAWHNLYGISKIKNILMKTNVRL